MTLLASRNDFKAADSKTVDQLGFDLSLQATI